MSSEHERMQSFEEFWPYYVGEHLNPTTRKLHFVGTTAALGCVAWGILLGKKKYLWPAALVAGYGPAWFSHFFIEKNKPATFKYPAWSLYADFVMWSKMIQGTMDAEVERVIADREAKASQANGHVNGQANGQSHPDAG
jgi:hypothetical protein